MNSINTNLAALQGVQAFNAVSTDLAATQRRIATGLKVASAKDNGATWAIANLQRSASASLTTVNQSLSRAASAIDVGLSAGAQVADILNEMKGLALAAIEPTIDATSRSALLEEYEGHRSRLIAIIDGAEFDGLNVLKSPSALKFLSDADGTQSTTIQGQDWNYSPWTPGPVIMLRGYSLDTVTYAQYALDEVNQTIPNVAASLSRLGVFAKGIEGDMAFNGKLQDSLDAGVGNLVDADLGKESAKLQAQQAKQSLAQKALSIANAAPQWILNLFAR